MHQPHRRPLSAAAFAALFAALSMAQGKAATLVGTVNEAPASPVNLTDAGMIDWAIWGSTAGGAVASVSPSNEKLGGSIFGDITAVGANANARGAGGSGLVYSYTDGTSPTSASSTTGMTLSFGLETIGNGVTLSIAGEPGTVWRLQLWGAGFDGQGTLTASLDGAEDLIFLSQLYPVSTPKGATLFTIDYMPDAADDLLTLTYVLSADGGFNSNSHVGIQAAAVSIIPEPGSAALLFGGVALLAGFRRRR